MDNGNDILIIEDHAIVLLGLSTVLGTCRGIRSISKAQTGKEALELFSTKRFDVVILDVELPDISGFDLLAKLRTINPDVSIVFHSMHEEFWIIRQMLNSGADAIVLKSDNVDELRTAVEAIIAGECFYSSRFEDYCKQYEQQVELSDREMEVLSAISSGLKTQEIADKLFVSGNTVEFHRRRILRKLGASNMAELIRKAIEKGYLKL